MLLGVWPLKPFPTTLRNLLLDNLAYCSGRIGGLNEDYSVVDYVPASVLVTFVVCKPVVNVVSSHITVKWFLA